MATLTWETPQGPQEHRLGTVTHIGRAPTNQIALADRGVSGYHARISYEDGQWMLVDEGSRNGTFVNDERQERCALHPGDEVRVGSTVLTFQAGEDSAAVTLVWKKEEASATEVTDEPASAERQATSFDELFHDDIDYSEVSSVDPARLATLVAPRESEDPRQMMRRLRASSEISRATAATLDLSAIMDRVLEALFEIFEDAERAFIVLVDPDSGEVSTAAVKRRVKKRAAQMPISQTALRQAMRTRQAMLCGDAATDDRFAASQSIMSLGIRSMMIAPLVFRDEVLGAVHVDTVTGIKEFTQPDLELLSIAASEVAACVANARLHERMVRSERLAAVGQTLAGLTHCIKNILQGIKGGAFILDLGLQKDNMDRVRQGWEMVQRNNAFMEELVYDLLTYSKERQPAYEETDVNALCADIVAMCGERAREKDVALGFEPDALLEAAELDAKGVKRALMNFVMNAIDACADGGGSVTVRTAAPGDDGMLRITVEDTGCGMPPEVQAKLFSVFFSTKGSKGTGLGLPVSQKIIEEHGGRVDVESAEGEGTTFAVCLPPVRPAGKTDTQTTTGPAGA
ncbi:MAG: ATP-binding protein [Planctomycetota bacterium]